MAEEIVLTIVTVRDIFQDEAGRVSKFSDEYQRLSALIILDKGDMARLSVSDGERLLVKNDIGAVVVTAKAIEDEPHPGIAFMNKSPWANQLVSEGEGKSDIPGFNSITATAARALKGADVTGIDELLSRMRG